MERLTNDNPQGFLSAALNFVYDKDKQIYLRCADGIDDLLLAEYISRMASKEGCAVSAEDVMDGACFECDCVLAILNAVATQAAELRSRLKRYEDIELSPEEISAMRIERDALTEKLGGTIPVHCKDCELWGTGGWSQYQIGYCAGDEKPHKPNDFCS